MIAHYAIIFLLIPGIEPGQRTYKDRMLTDTSYELLWKREKNKEERVTYSLPPFPLCTNANFFIYTFHFSYVSASALRA